MDVSPAGSGTIIVNDQVITSYPATVSFNNGESVSIKAIPDSNYEFIDWEGSLSGNDNPATITMTCTKNVTANFYRPQYTLNIESSGDGTTSPATGSYTYYKGDEVSISATPDDGWQFDGWSGDMLTNQSGDITVIIDLDKTLVANFSQIMHTVSLTVTGNGSTIPAAEVCEYPEGSIVNIAAVPDEGWQFDGWTGDIVDAESTNIAFTMDSSKTINANFSVIKTIDIKWLITGISLFIVLAAGSIWFAVKKRAT